MESVMAAAEAGEGSSPHQDVRGMRGVDNLAATDDNEARLQAEHHVITTQPQISPVESNRAPLPLSTLNWRSTNSAQFLPIHGLDFLIGVPALSIQQTVELGDLMTHIESENRYMVKVPGGETLYIGSEASSAAQRALCGAGRAFTLRLHDATRQEALVLQRRLAATSCCFPCRLQEMKVTVPPGNYVGRVQQRWTLMAPFYLVRDASDDVIFVVEGPAIKPCSNATHVEFKVLTGDSLTVQGSIRHAWDRQLVSYLLTVNFPRAAADPKHKALLVAAAFLLWMQAYRGGFVCDAMHGEGEYRVRHCAGAATYEGQLYADRLQGYGHMSYADQAVFTGLFCDNRRFGPGVERGAGRSADVGLWRGRQLVRLAWRPPLPAVPDLAHGGGPAAAVAPHRTKLRARTVCINDNNIAVDVMRECGATEEQIEAHWRSLCADRCTQPDSAFFHRALFDGDTFGDNMETLEVVDIVEDPKTESSHSIAATEPTSKLFYCWNNAADMIQIMQHCYKHARYATINVANIMNGKRQAFRPAGTLELNCRTLLLSCHLGDTLTVARLVNDCHVHPDISDSKGNSALMYACSADQHETIAFLLTAGACVKRENDACLTPLTLSLLRYLATASDASTDHFSQIFTPPEFFSSQIEKVCSEWMFNLGNPSDDTVGSQSLKPKGQSLRKLKSLSSVKVNKHRTSPLIDHDLELLEPDEDTMEAEADAHQKNYFKALRAFRTSTRSEQNTTNMQYLLHVDEIVKDLDLKSMSIFDNIMTKSMTTLQKSSAKQAEAKTIAAKNRSKVILKLKSQNSGEESSIASSVQLKIQKLADIEATVLQLADGGAAPACSRCPLPALALAALGCSPAIVCCLLERGADADETFPERFGYRAVDIALSRPLSMDSLAAVRALLDGGATVAHRLSMPEGSAAADVDDTGAAGERDAGPTLLHVVIDKKVESDAASTVQRTLLKLLLGHGADAAAQFQGRSAIDYAMQKDLTLLETFAESAGVDLNAGINALDENVLVKMFSVSYIRRVDQSEWLQSLSSVLLHGADPLLSCRKEDVTYRNLFEFAQAQAKDLVDSSAQKPLPNKKAATEGKGKNEMKKPTPSKPAESGALGEEHTRGLQMAASGAREQHARWLRARLLTALFRLVRRLKHRPWPIIVRDCNHEKATVHWLTLTDALTTWDLLKSTGEPLFLDNKLIIKVMYIIQYFQTTKFMDKLSLKDIEVVEKTVKSMMKEYKMAATSSSQPLPSYNVFRKHDKRLERASKYNICFECSLPLSGNTIQCIYCEQVAFCSDTCLDSNILREDCHPCSVLMSRPDTPHSQGNVIA